MTSAQVLTVDIGNSRLKWALWKNAEPVEQGACAYDDNLSAVLSEVWAKLEVPTNIMLACVAGAAVESEVQSWLDEHWNMQAQTLVSTKHFAGLSHAYQRPEQHGADRWAAMIAAHELYPETALCIISCGTATTVDVIDASGRHLGGQIMPGIELMLASLKSRIPVLSDLEFSSNESNPVFASNTADAVQLGVMQMAVAGLDRACDAARDTLGVDVKILVTGGAAADMLALMKNSAELQPDLVLRGLYLTSQQGRG